MVVSLIRKMARKRKQERPPLFDDLTPQARQGIGAVLFGVLGIFFALSSMGYAGFVGDMTHSALKYLFGYGFILAPLACLLYVVALLRPRIDTGTTSVSKIIGITLLFISLLGMFSLYREDMGGFFGWALEAPLGYFLSSAAAGIVMFGILVVSIILTFNIGLTIPKKDPKKKIRAEESDDRSNNGFPASHLLGVHGQTP